MITFLQQGRIDRNNFAVTEHQERATHYDEDGEIFTIGKLVTQQKENAEQPMPVPSLNFSEVEREQQRSVMELAEYDFSTSHTEDVETENTLDLPAMDFSAKHTEDQTELLMHEAGAEEPMDVPA